MDIDVVHCWDCPLNLSTAVLIAVAGLALLFLAGRLYSTPSVPLRLLGGAAAGLTIFILAGVAKYVGTSGLSVSQGAIDLPYYTRFLFLGGLVLLGAGILYAARSRSGPAKGARL